MSSSLSKAFAVSCLVFSMMAVTRAVAATVLAFPKDAPAFTFEQPDGMQCDYQNDGRLVCTTADGALKGVFLALKDMRNDQGVRLGLNRLIRLTGPSFLTGAIQYPAPFDEDTKSGVHTINVSAFGQRDGKQAGLALIVFSKTGKYYELIVSGAVDSMKAANFPHSFRETMKLTP